MELQNDLIAVEDTKSEGDTLEAHAIIASSSPRESKYLLEHLLDLVLNLVSTYVCVAITITIAFTYIRTTYLQLRCLGAKVPKVPRCLGA